MGAQESPQPAVQTRGHRAHPVSPAGAAATAVAVEEAPDVEAQGPHVPGVDEAENVIQGQDEVDDLLSSLGF